MMPRAPSPKPPPAVQRWKHGTTGYRKHGCHCDVCRAAWAAHQRGIRARKRAASGLPPRTHTRRTPGPRLETPVIVLNTLKLDELARQLCIAARAVTYTDREAAELLGLHPSRLSRLVSRFLLRAA